MNALRINQLSDDAFEWYVRYLDALDCGDAEALRAYIHEDCIMQINDNLPLYGASVILGALKHNWTRFERIEHEPTNIYGSDRRFAVEMLWHFTRRDSSQRVTVPACSFVDRGDDGRACSVRLFANLAPAFEKRRA